MNTVSRTQATFSQLQRWLCDDSSESREALVQQLAKIFDASGAGLYDASGPEVRLRDAATVDAQPSPARLPWDGNGSLLHRVRSSSRGLAQTTDGLTWLLSLAWEPGHGQPVLVVLWRDGARGWDEEDMALLPLAAQAVVRVAYRPDDSSPGAGQVAVLRPQLDRAAVLTSRLTHDFGNMLTGILGFAELSLANVKPESPAHGYLQEVVAAARLGANWVHRLHLFCRRTGGADPWPTPLAPLLAEQAARLQDLGAAGIQWEATFPDDLPLLAIEAEGLRHVLTQLVDNAQEAVKGTGTVRVSARPLELDNLACQELLGGARPGRFVEVTIRDSGPGISPDMRARLFTDIFSSSKPRHRGLGLLVVYGVLQRFGGGLQVRPTSELGGAAVSLYLPASAVPPAGPELRGARVLVVHPDPVTRQSLRAVLTTAGCDVTPAADPQEALALYQPPRRLFDLVVAEVRMAPLTGPELARRLLERDPRGAFLFLQSAAGFPGPVHDELARRFELLSRPFDPPALLTAVARNLPADRRPAPTDAT